MTACNCNRLFWGSLLFGFAVLVGATVWAVPCNKQTPTLGNCGSESTCESRSHSQCNATYGHYFEDWGPIGCQEGAVSNYCEEFDPAQQMPPQDKMDCTCEWNCFWSNSLYQCVKNTRHNDPQGNPICSHPAKHFRSLPCDIPGT